MLHFLLNNVFPESFWWFLNLIKDVPDAYSQSYKASKMELFVKIVNSFHPLTIFASSLISDVWKVSGYISGFYWKSCLDKLEDLFSLLLTLFEFGYMATLPLFFFNLHQKNPSKYLITWILRGILINASLDRSLLFFFALKFS